MRFSRRDSVQGRSHSLQGPTRPTDVHVPDPHITQFIHQSRSFSRQHSQGNQSFHNFDDKKKYLLVLLSCVHTILVSGAVYGWTALRSVFIHDGVFGSFSKYQRDSCLSFVATLGISANALCRLPLGVFMDACGPRSTSVLGSCLFIVGCLFISLVHADNVHMITIGYFLLGIAGPFLQIPCFQFANLFPRVRSVVISVLVICFEISTGVFALYAFLYFRLDNSHSITPKTLLFSTYHHIPADITSLIVNPSNTAPTTSVAASVASMNVTIAETTARSPPLFHSFYSNSTVNQSLTSFQKVLSFQKQEKSDLFEAPLGRRNFFLAYACVGLFTLITSAIMWPDKSFDVNSPDSVTRERYMESQSIDSSSYLFQSETRLNGAALLKQFSSREFVYVTIFFVLHVFRQGFAFTTMGPQAEAFFDLDTAYFLEQVFSISLPFGFLPMGFCTAIGLVTYVLNHPNLAFLFVNSLSIVYGLLFIVKTTPSYITLFVFFPLSRQFVFALFYSYTSSVFGTSNFGKISGLSSTIASVFQIFGQPSLIHEVTIGRFSWTLVDLCLAITPVPLLIIPLYSIFYQRRSQDHLQLVSMKHRNVQSPPTDYSSFGDFTECSPLLLSDRDKNSLGHRDGFWNVIGPESPEAVQSSPSLDFSLPRMWDKLP